MNERKPFLTAHWGNLLLLNYPAPDEALRPYLPPGCELDRFGGSAFLSLVAFQFTRTKVFGLRWPGFTDFPELNLRFYIRHQGRRGVCFVREFVPSRLVAGIARWIYNEPYKAARMQERVTRDAGGIHALYTLRDGPHSLHFEARACGQPYLPPEHSLEHFFKEHELGVGRDRDGSAVTYDVHHPVWRVYPVQSYEVRLDARGLYGDAFAFLETTRPASVVLAEGSEIVVYTKN